MKNAADRNRSRPLPRSRIGLLHTCKASSVEALKSRAPNLEHQSIDTTLWMVLHFCPARRSGPGGHSPRRGSGPGPGVEFPTGCTPIAASTGATPTIEPTERADHHRAARRWRRRDFVPRWHKFNCCTVQQAARHGAAGYGDHAPPVSVCGGGGSVARFCGRRTVAFMASATPSLIAP